MVNGFELLFSPPKDFEKPRSRVKRCIVVRVVGLSRGRWDAQSPNTNRIIGGKPITKVFHVRRERAALALGIVFPDPLTRGNENRARGGKDVRFFFFFFSLFRVYVTWYQFIRNSSVSKIFVSFLKFERIKFESK